MLSDALRQRIASSGYNIRSQSGPAPRRGLDIFAGDYPTSWGELVGQEQAILHLRAAIKSAQVRGERLDNILLASGAHGIGKSSIARLIAYEMGVGFLELSGVVSVDEARTVLRVMEDGDVLFYDEIHQAVTGGKSKAEWLLHLLQDGVLVTGKGAEVMPKITVVAATTDAQRLPQTVLSRFMVRPTLEAYDHDQATEIAGRLAGRMHLDPIPDQDLLAAVGQAANQSPRDMKALLVALRDGALAGECGYDLAQALRWVGVTFDGLNRLAQDYLVTLLVMCDGTAGAATIASSLGEPGPLGHTEQLLARKGYIQIQPNGRSLTDEGHSRTVALLTEQGLLPATD